MKKILSIVIVYGGMTAAYAQNYISGPMSVYGLQYNSTTTIATGGRILVGSGGNWFFAGKIISADKASSKAPTTIGRTQQIVFSGTGKYSGIALIDGYASTVGQTTAFILPVGNSISPYPVTVPAGAAITTAYFDGSGNTQSVVINGMTTTIYSPYFDIPTGITAGNYTFSYPSGFKSTTTSMLLSGNNTTGNFNILSALPTFQPNAGAASANLSTLNAMQTYFGSSNAILPVSLLSFTGLVDNCTANLAWQTSSESNSNYFEIETSSDGAVFTAIDKVANKNSSVGAAYNYAYNKLGNATTYFRLKAVDNDGSFVYSQIITVTGTNACSPNVFVKVWPNPTTDKVNIQGVLEGSQIALINMNGQKLTELVAAGINQTINLNGFANGVYVLNIRNTDGSITNIKVIKN
jgi:hypothetical protein